MRRSVLTLGVAVGLAAWSSGQGPAPLPTADQQLEMLQTNRGLLERLLQRGVAISDADSTVTRVDACRSAAMTMADELRATTADTPPGRVEELADQLSYVWAEGLARVLADARREIAPGSPEFDRLQAVEQQAVADVKRVTAGWPDRSSAGPGVREALENLERAGKLIRGGE